MTNQPTQRVQRAHIGSAFALLVACALSACNISISPVNTGPTQTARVSIPAPADLSTPWELTLSPAAASVVVDTGPAGATGLMSGTIDYNILAWKPLITMTNHSVVIKQSEFSGIPPANTVNDWRLRIGQGVPLSLTVQAGAIKGDWDLGGLSLRSLDWRQGAADTTLHFNQPNPDALEHMNVDAGASSLKVEGLANANVRATRVNIGAGALMLRFDGSLTRDLTVTVEGGAAALTIDSGGNPVQVVVGKSLTAINHGEWTNQGDIYHSPEWPTSSGPRVTVQANLGAASLNLVTGR
jgi:hypothetical protein